MQLAQQPPANHVHGVVVQHAVVPLVTDRQEQVLLLGFTDHLLAGGHGACHELFGQHGEGGDLSPKIAHRSLVLSDQFLEIRINPLVRAPIGLGSQSSNSENSIEANLPLFLVQTPLKIVKDIPCLSGPIAK